MAKLSISKAWEETKAIITRDGRLFVAVALALFVLPGIILAVRDAIIHGARRVLPYLAAVLLWSLPFILVGAALAMRMSADPEHPSPAVALGFLLLFVPVTFLFVRLMLSSPVASAEPAGPIAILQRSWSLSSGSWWRLFGFLMLFGIGALALLVAVGAVVGLVAKLLLGGIEPMTVGGLLVALVGQVLSAALSVVFFVMLARLYVQRAEGEMVQPSVPSSGT
jgi:hypothetical protein